MPVIEVTDPLEARRAKYSLYANTGKAISLNGEMVSGLIKSVFPHPTANPPKWVVTFYESLPSKTEVPKVKVSRRR